MRGLMPRLALAGLCLAIVVFALRFGSFVAGGSDSYCYLHQAERWASGSLLATEPLALQAPWPDAAATFAPAGHRASLTVPGAIVPICPSGFSILLSLFVLAGGNPATSLAVPLSGALLVVATGLLGARIRPAVGLGAALVTAASPIVLFQVIQPMSDVPAAAFWLAALAAATASSRRAAVLAGAAAGIAILIRPNLVPLGFVIGVYLLARPERVWRARLSDATLYAAGCAVGCVGVLAIQRFFYGSPWASGYGATEDLFAISRVGVNLVRYGRWLFESQSAAILLALAAPFLLAPSFSALCLSFCAVTLAVYLPYLSFDDWAYVRFLLPAIPVSAVLVMGVIAAANERTRPRWVAASVATAAIAFSLLGLPVARRHQVFQLAALESDFPRVGTASSRLPENALVFTSRYSGSVRYYGHRRTLVWDVLDPAWLDRAVAFATEQGLEPYVIVGSSEEGEFRQRFNGSALAALDWPPAIEVAPQVRVYRPADRTRYQRGERVDTAYVR
jgi:hypothetical protein